MIKLNQMMINYQFFMIVYFELEKNDLMKLLKTYQLSVMI